MECESKSDDSNNRGDWKHFKITQTTPEQRTGKHDIKKLQNNSHIGH